MSRRKARPACPIPSADADVLRYAGAFGHTLAVVCDGKEGRYLYVETSSVQRAWIHAEDVADQNPAVYERATKGWRALP